MNTLPTYFISHGGGPWPWMQDQAGGYAKLAAALQAMSASLPTPPKAILMVSAHWEEANFTVQTAAQPGMIYDYSGFPAHTYEVTYPAPGAPDVAKRVKTLLTQAGIAADEDAERGFDHGTYSPLAVMFPQANIPVLQLSLKQGLDPEAHLAAGRALRPLRDEGILIVGSGLSYHNLRELGPKGQAPSAAFDAWLQSSVVQAHPHDREKNLRAWATAPAARQAHPREEHLLPLMVAVGAAGDDAATCPYHEATFFGAVTVSSFRFGPA
ncbi:class III extradiol ring-cleavage dioxygenase [Rhodoferax sp. PAMC 29310]|uniref:DODA-type extradiol aromatic ring-opening family dioxygenase n=1 Tax=Rhodoferax sp. PAMC 29310 TaxID=2822760 RepID=UPI001B32554D|nr:class III extradiol ring-cleavage dioxygenase [Rhodoferax sp. PAMC 29310]